MNTKNGVDTSSVISPLFVSKNPTISNTQRRVFGLLHSGENPKDIGFFGAMAYRAHGGANWQKRSPEHMERDLKAQMHGGRALELILCEALIQQGKSFHFLPPKELDMSYKMDLCSRVPYRDKESALHTFCIGSQITIAPLPGNHEYDRHDVIGTSNDRYEQKYRQMQAIAPYLHNSVTRSEIKSRFGKLTLPDIICYIAVNGQVGKSFTNTSGYTLMKFHEWKRTGFSHEQLLGHFKPRIREGVNLVAHFVDWTQGYLISDEFHIGLDQDSASEDTTTIPGARIRIAFDKKLGELSCELSDMETGEQLVRMVYFLSDADIQKLVLKSDLSDNSNELPGGE